MPVLFPGLRADSGLQATLRPLVVHVARLPLAAREGASISTSQVLLRVLEDRHWRGPLAFTAPLGIETSIPLGILISKGLELPAGRRFVMVVVGRPGLLGLAVVDGRGVAGRAVAGRPVLLGYCRRERRGEEDCVTHGASPRRWRFWGCPLRSAHCGLGQRNSRIC